MAWAAEPDTWISLLTLTILEIVLGVDNIVFISILSGKLPAVQQGKARHLGLSLALITRVLLLCALAWMVKLTQPLFEVFDRGVSGRDLILIAGGLFLIYKATKEVHHKLEGEDGEVTRRLAPRFAAVIVQILLLDIVFSLDSVITAVGMARQIGVMIAAVILAVGFMLVFAGHISRFIDRHPSLKVLALSFLLMIGVTLVMEGCGKEVHKGYIYFAMAFSAAVEGLNIRMRSKQAKSVDLHQPYR
ncbi:MAG TPA: TerC family protein [Verrucomicrobiae bacterium]|nr:TerC family protein [Verrucomicrobiae bacterium]